MYKELSKEEFRKYAVKGQGISGSVFDQYASRVENMTRSVIEERPTRFAEIDVFSRLIMDRIIFLGMQVEENIGNIITAQLLFLESVDAKKDILLYVNSPGGSVYAGLGIYDTMQYVTPDVATICTGMAASMGAVLLAGGAKNKRSALPHARIMIHQPSGGMQGQARDMEITLRQMQELRKDLYTILSNHTGKPYEQVEKDSDRDNWMRPTEAKEYGLIDEVLQRKSSK
ncbi:ATP-dependent Clp protease proteolytic subunit [Imperialibacter roseus]|jgi:ATP-dependent Clp protease, protease subunit|uniref:ATP-dependent Clp protease proteolytic subunit n=1 Tax=Imperialibacter roseus TaxID=1324217 RepID=A0ABZ0ILN8_9BACT|nr:ATP-dependent Clp protease proteolytic subunit [Imperialibacter roseus]WOK05427.1 ATP-dependent Clp protease proteolytic subunit [Imperialibacter roseus]|tara:strand:- start:41837 stop:42523 length:687 start_codon:yes stop_codon:yes gene_type:complete